MIQSVEVRDGSGLLRPLKTFAYGTSGQKNPPLGAYSSFNVSWFG